MSLAVSVIVPVYNVAPYIERCARSLFEQTLENLEIIFIDDCSPDNSVEIINRVLNDYPSRRINTRILRPQTNQGQAGVRRMGIIEAKGDYIIHCDGDDWVDKELYQVLYDAAIRSNADIVVCDEVAEYDNYSIKIPTGNFQKNGKDLMKNWYKTNLGMFCHNKLVKRALYTDNVILPWVGLNMWEDNGLFARLFYYAEKIVQIHGEPVYHYNRMNVNAMTAGYGTKQIEQMIGIAQNIEQFYANLPDSECYKKTVDAFKYLARINLITDSFRNYLRFRKTFPESNYIAKEIRPSAFSKKGRIRFYMVKFGLAPLFIFLFKLKNIISK